MHFLRQILFDMIIIWSFMTFWFLYFVSGYWFIFFKWEKHVFTFMPLPSEDLQSYHDWRVLFWIMFGGCCFAAAVIIWRQAQLDFFFLDWEKSKNPPPTPDDIVRQAVRKGLTNSQLMKKSQRFDQVQEKQGSPI